MKKNTKMYRSLAGGDFTESFLMRVELRQWPNELLFVVWAPRDETAYRITTQTVLEFHYMRTGTGRLGTDETGIPLGNIYVTYEEEFTYWMHKIRAFVDQGYDVQEEPVCLEFDSPLFGNRKRETRRDKNSGILVVCRKVIVKEDYSYAGPRPTPYLIPSDE